MVDFEHCTLPVCNRMLILLLLLICMLIQNLTAPISRYMVRDTEQWRPVPMGGGSVFWKFSGSVTIFQHDSSIFYLSLPTPTISIVLYVSSIEKSINSEICNDVSGCPPNTNTWELSN